MTTIRARLRTVASASLLALAIISLPAASAYAAPNTTPQGRCASAGGVWDPKRGCATKACEHNGSYYSHGERVTVNGGDYGGYVKVRKQTTYSCDGFTGNWTQV